MANHLSKEERIDRLERLKGMLLPKGATEDLTMDEKVGITIERFIGKLDEVSFTLKNINSLKVSPLADSINELIDQLKTQKEDKSENTKSNKDLGVTINRLILNMEKFVRTSHAQTKYEENVNKRFNDFQIKLKDMVDSIIMVSQSISSVQLKAEIINIDAVKNISKQLEEMIEAQSEILQEQVKQTERLIKSAEKIVPHKKGFEDNPIEQSVTRDEKGRINTVRQVYSGGVVIISTVTRDSNGAFLSMKSRKE